MFLLFLLCPLSKVAQYAMKDLTMEEEEGPRGRREPRPNNYVSALRITSVIDGFTTLILTLTHKTYVHKVCFMGFLTG